MANSAPALSVIIATLNRHDLLAGCLEAISPQVQTATDPYEVIVVDQTGRSDRTLDVTRRFPFARNVSMPSPGLAAARNRGVAEARAEIVAFIDDDVIVDHCWVAAMVEAFRGERQSWVEACGGRVRADYGSQQRPSWLEPPLERFLSCLDFGDEPGPLKVGQWVVGASFAARRRVLLTLGGFDARLGRRGGNDLLSNEEAAIVATLGLNHVLYNPAAEARHLIPLERMAQSWFRKRVCWQAVSDVLSGSTFLEARRKGRMARGDDDLADMAARSLLADVGSYDALEVQLTQLYDLVSAAMESGRLEFLAHPARLI